jgi:hypothetical protein
LAVGADGSLLEVGANDFFRFAVRERRAKAS